MKAMSSLYRCSKLSVLAALPFFLLLVEESPALLFLVTPLGVLLSMALDLTAALLSGLVIAWSHRPFGTLFDCRGIITFLCILDEAIAILPAFCWVLPLASTVMDPLPPESASPLPKTILPLYPMLIFSLLEVFAPSSFAVPVPVSVFMSHLSLSVVSAFA